MWPFAARADALDRFGAPRDPIRAFAVSLRSTATSASPGRSDARGARIAPPPTSRTSGAMSSPGSETTRDLGRPRSFVSLRRERAARTGMRALRSHFPRCGLLRLGPPSSGGLRACRLAPHPSRVPPLFPLPRGEGWVEAPVQRRGLVWPPPSPAGRSSAAARLARGSMCHRPFRRPTGARDGEGKLRSDARGARAKNLLRRRLRAPPLHSGSFSNIRPGEKNFPQTPFHKPRRRGTSSTDDLEESLQLERFQGAQRSGRYRNTQRQRIVPHGWLCLRSFQWDKRRGAARRVGRRPNATGRRRRFSLERRPRRGQTRAGRAPTDRRTPQAYRSVRRRGPAVEDARIHSMYGRRLLVTKVGVARYSPLRPLPHEQRVSPGFDDLQSGESHRVVVKEVVAADLVHAGFDVSGRDLAEKGAPVDDRGRVRLDPQLVGGFPDGVRSRRHRGARDDQRASVFLGHRRRRLGGRRGGGRRRHDLRLARRRCGRWNLGSRSGRRRGRHRWSRSGSGNHRRRRGRLHGRRGNGRRRRSFRLARRRCGRWGRHRGRSFDGRRRAGWRGGCGRCHRGGPGGRGCRRRAVDDRGSRSGRRWRRLRRRRRSCIRRWRGGRRRRRGDRSRRRRRDRNRRVRRRFRRLRRRKRRGNGRLGRLTFGSGNRHRLEPRLLSGGRRRDGHRLHRRGDGRRRRGGRGLVEPIRLPERGVDLFDGREERIPRFLGQKAFVRVFVAACGDPVERHDALFRGRFGRSGEAGHLVFEPLPELRDLRDRGVGIGERLLKSLAGVVERLELSPVDSPGRRRRGRRLRERDRRTGNEEESARKDLHAGLLQSKRLSHS